METVLLVAALLLLVWNISEGALLLSGKKHYKFYGVMEKGVFLSTALLIIATVLGFIGVIDMTSIRGFCVAASAVSVFVVFINIAGFRNHLKSRHLIFALKVLLVLCVLECCVFNFSSLHLIWGGYETNLSVELGSDDVSYDGMELENNNLFTEISKKEKTVSITIDNINKAVGTVLIDYTSTARKIDSNIAFTDATYSAKLRTGQVSNKILSGASNSRYIKCDLSGSSETIKVSFKIPEKETFVLTGITLNAPIPFRFSLLRTATIFAIVFGIYILFSADKMKKAVNANKRYTSFIALIITLAAILSVGFGATLAKGGFGGQMTEELVDAFRSGQLELIGTPSEELLALENPYDRGQREGVNYKWDHLLFEGKYYSYYGIAPVVLVFLPYNLLTGAYMNANLYILIASIFGLIFLAKLYLYLIETKFPRLKLSMAMAGLIVLLTSCGIFYSVARPHFYEIAIASGFMCLTMGAYFLLSSNILTAKKTVLWRLCLASTLLGLSVLSRPTLAVYCVAAVIFFVFGYLKERKEEAPAKLRYIICSILPLAFLACVQMAYNYLRFGSILDFGIQYSLTINDFTNSQFHFSFVWVSLFGFLFASPYLVPYFPYLTSSFQRLNMDGYYYVDNASLSGLSIGLFFKALPMWFYFKAHKAYALMKKATRRRDMLLIIASCVVAPLVIIAMIWESGFAVRYSADINWQMLIGALCIFFVIYGGEKNPTKTKAYEVFMIVAVVTAVVVCGAQYFSFIEHHAGESNGIYSPVNVLNYISYTFNIFN